MSYERDSIKTLAAELGVTSNRLYKWRLEYAEHGESSFQRHGIERLSDDGERVKELERKLKNTELELGKPNEAMVGASLLELRLARRFPKNA